MHFQNRAVHKTRFAQWLNINNERILVKAFLFMGESWQAAHVNSRKVIVQKPQGNSLLVDSWNKRLSCVRTNNRRGKSRYHCVHNHFILANIDILNLPFTKQLDLHISWIKPVKLFVKIKYTSVWSVMFLNRKIFKHKRLTDKKYLGIKNHVKILNLSLLNESIKL